MMTLTYTLFRNRCPKKSKKIAVLMSRNQAYQRTTPLAVHQLLIKPFSDYLHHLSINFKNLFNATTLSQKLENRF